jgi:hypothetical protein
VIGIFLFSIGGYYTIKSLVLQEGGWDRGERKEKGEMRDEMERGRW